MKNNIIDIIDNNKFLLKLFPDGLNKFALGSLNLRINDRIYLDLHTSQKPNIPISKWGEWNENYNVIVIQIIAQYVQNMEIVNFQNNKVGICKFTKEFNNGVYKLEFSNDEWSVKLDLKSLTFQNCSTYVNDFLIE